MNLQFRRQYGGGERPSGTVSETFSVRVTDSAGVTTPQR